MWGNILTEDVKLFLKFVKPKTRILVSSLLIRFPFKWFSTIVLVLKLLLDKLQINFAVSKN